MPEPRVVLVTGASRGIGRAISRAFALRGDTVVLVSRDITGLEETARLVETAGGKAVVLPTDVTDPADVEEMKKRLMDLLGRVDVLVANAGVGGPSGLLWELSLEDWRTTFAVNVDGVFLSVKAVMPLMVEQRSGSIVVIGSISGKRPLYGRSAYTSTKMALVGLVRTLATEAGPYGVRVNLISPGFVAGPRLDWVISAQAKARGVSEEAVEQEMRRLSPLDRLTEAEDVAHAAVFLASDEARAITGADLNVNSGVVMY